MLRGESNLAGLISLYPKSHGVILVSYSPDNQVGLYKCSLGEKGMCHIIALY